jgi:hypothetical protein
MVCGAGSNLTRLAVASTPWLPLLLGMDVTAGMAGMARGWQEAGMAGMVLFPRHNWAVGLSASGDITGRSAGASGDITGRSAGASGDITGRSAGPPS